MKMRLMLGVACAGLALSMPAADAHALKNFDTTGTVGRATYYQIQGWALPHYVTQLQLPGPTVYRSKAYKGTQAVEVKRYLMKVLPSTPGEGLNQWRLDRTYVSYAFIKPGRKHTFKHWTLTDAQPYVNYHVFYRVTYRSAPGGQLARGRRLGRTYTSFNKSTDYYCNTAACNTGYTTPGSTAYISMVLL